MICWVGRSGLKAGNLKEELWAFSQFCESPKSLKVNNFEIHLIGV